MHPDMEKAIALIDHQIIELQKARRILTEAFGERLGDKENKTNLPLAFPAEKKSNRRDSVLELLRMSGPLTRSEIVKKSGIPVGTVSAVLNDKTMFKNQDGKWNLIEAKKEAKPTEEKPT